MLRCRPILLSLAGLALAGSLAAGPPAQAALPTGKPAPEFALAKFEGGQISLRQMRGKVVLVNFWSPV